MNHLNFHKTSTTYLNILSSFNYPVSKLKKKKLVERTVNRITNNCMMVHHYNLNTREAGAGVQKFKTYLECIVRPYLNLPFSKNERDSQLPSTTSSDIQSSHLNILLNSVILLSPSRRQFYFIDTFITKMPF